jgi:phage repressor protein C with HTH and peptisase S24 domain
MGNKQETINRIFQELKEKGMVRNKKEFAALLGVEYTNLVAAMNGSERSLTDSLLAKAIALPNTINERITQADGNVLPGKVIPFYDADVAAGTQYGVDMTARASAMALIEIGNVLNDSEVAIRVYGNSMVPNYPAGCVIGVKKATDSFIVPGHVYVVETADNRYLKRLYYSKDKKALRCISDNTMLHESGSMKGEYIYPEFEIPLAEVKAKWQVVGVIKRNLM